MSFALNLAVPADKVLKTKQVYCASPATGASEGGMKETGGQGDEADTGRIQVGQAPCIVGLVGEQGIMNYTGVMMVLPGEQGKSG